MTLVATPKEMRYVTMEEILGLLNEFKVLIGTLLGSGLVACEITPIIKFKPITMFLNWLGKKLNKEVIDDINKLKIDVKTIQKDLQDHTVESMRRDILNFADKLRFDKLKSKEEYDYIIGLYDRYEKYLRDNNLDNGKVELAYEYITKKYKECMENNSFYTGK